MSGLLKWLRIIWLIAVVSLRVSGDFARHVDKDLLEVSDLAVGILEWRARGTAAGGGGYLGDVNRTTPEGHDLAGGGYGRWKQ